MSPAESHFLPKTRGRRSSLTPAREAQLRRLVAERPSAYLRELAQAMGSVVYPSTIRKWCVKLGLPHRQTNGPRSRMTPEIKDRLLALASRQPPACFGELAQATGNSVSGWTIRMWCKKLGLAHRRGPGLSGKLPPEAEMHLRALLAERQSPYFHDLTRAIGKRVDRRTMKKWCVKLGLTYKPITGPRSKMTPEMEKRLRALLAERPAITRKELATAMGNVVSSRTIIDWRKKLGLPYQPASRKESRRLTPEMESRLRLLLAAERPRASYLELGRELQVSSQAVRRWVKRLRLPHRNRRK